MLNFICFIASEYNYSFYYSFYAFGEIFKHLQLFFSRRYKIMLSFKARILVVTVALCFLAISRTIDAKANNHQLQEDQDLAAIFQDPEVFDPPC